MRASSRLVGQILARLKKETVPGITTHKLDKLAERLCRDAGVKPAFKGYGGFPFCICASVNHQVVHGFPSKDKLQEGDILSIDFGVIRQGFYGDAAITVAVGRVDDEAWRLMRVTKECLERAITQVQAGNRLGDLSHAVQSHAEENGFSVVRQFVGHGIGKSMHEEPQIPNFGPCGQGLTLKPGMVLAIEPMINAGTYEVKVLSDGWTAVTTDGKLSAHFEHSVAVTDNGPLVLSANEGLEDLG